MLRIVFPVCPTGGGKAGAPLLQETPPLLAFDVLGGVCAVPVFYLGL